VRPWPYPKGKELPPLPAGGLWNTEGWTGAFLDTPALLRAGSGEAQAEAAESFLEAAIAACRELLARPEPEGAGEPGPDSREDS